MPILSEGGPTKWLKIRTYKIISPTTNQEVGSSNLSGRTNLSMDYATQILITVLLKRHLYCSKRFDVRKFGDGVL